jgi:gamma-glutamyltranspeptidase
MFIIKKTNKTTKSKEKSLKIPKKNFYFYFTGYQSVGVPGEVHGLWTAFKRFGSGKIAWMDLLMPTVNLLTEGQAIIINI